MTIGIIWALGIGLESLLLLRGAAQKLLKKYPLFYGYVGCVLLKEIIGVLTYRFARPWYDTLYWPEELITILASYAVMMEIFRCSTRHNPGVRRLSQYALMVVLVFTAAYSATDLFHSRFRSLSRTIAELGRDLRYVEGCLLLVMLWLLGRYRIPLGRNLQGLIAGYSFWVGINVVNLAILFQPGNESSSLLRNLLPASYVATLGIWCSALWAAYPEPALAAETTLERDYKLLVTRTQSILARASEHFA